MNWETAFYFFMSGLGAGLVIILVLLVIMEQRHLKRRRALRGRHVKESVFDYLGGVEAMQYDPLDLGHGAAFMKKEHEERVRLGPCAEETTKVTLRGQQYTEHCQRPRGHEGDHAYGYIPGVDEPQWAEPYRQPCTTLTSVERDQHGAMVARQCDLWEGHETDGLDHHFPEPPNDVERATRPRTSRSW